MAVIAASALSVAAQNVYSLNVVGYVNVQIPAASSPTTPSFTAIGNPLKNGNNTIQAVFGTQVPGGAAIMTFNGVGFDENTTSGGGAWDDDQADVSPGIGFFVKNNATTGFNITFVGEVLSGRQTNHMTSAFNFVSSKVPVSAANMMSDPNLNLTDVAVGDSLLVWNGAGYDENVYGGGGATGWDADPAYTVPMSFFYKQNPAAVRPAVDWITIGFP